jgi:hypothetical protein
VLFTAQYAFCDEGCEQIGYCVFGFLPEDIIEDELYFEETFAYLSVLRRVLGVVGAVAALAAVSRKLEHRVEVGW